MGSLGSSPHKWQGEGEPARINSPPPTAMRSSSPHGERGSVPRPAYRSPQGERAGARGDQRKKPRTGIAGSPVPSAGTGDGEGAPSRPPFIAAEIFRIILRIRENLTRVEKKPRPRWSTGAPDQRGDRRERSPEIQDSTIRHSRCDVRAHWRLSRVRPTSRSGWLKSLG